MQKDLSSWQPCSTPGGVVLEGQHVVLEPTDFARDSEALFEAVCGPSNDELWRWTFMGPFATAAEFRADMEPRAERLQAQPYNIRMKQTGQIEGMFFFMRIRESAGSAEIGAVVFGPHLQRTAAATEAVYLSAKHLFEECGYRRYEWKCNSGNAASRRAGERFGFTYEGTFRQDDISKGENRDTDWLSMLDTEWPARKAAFEAWLSPENFHSDGSQKKSLSEFHHG
jgi:RimJ/RimL family protein N-acetyltransferase